jgi:hypothetical protein
MEVLMSRSTAVILSTLVAILTLFVCKAKAETHCSITYRENIAKNCKVSGYGGNPVDELYFDYSTACLEALKVAERHKWKPVEGCFFHDMTVDMASNEIHFSCGEKPLPAVFRLKMYPLAPGFYRTTTHVGTW